MGIIFKTRNQAGNYLDVVSVHSPHLEAVVHAAGDDLGSVHVEVRTEYLISVPLNTTEDGNIVFSLDVPQP